MLHGGTVKMPLHFEQCAFKSMTQIALLNASLVRKDAKDVLIQQGTFRFIPFEYSQGCGPRDEQIATMHMQLIRDFAVRPIEWLGRVSEILNSNNLFPLLTPVFWLESCTINELGNRPQFCEIARHLSILSNSFIPCRISSSSFASSARISVGARCSTAACTTSL